MGPGPAPRRPQIRLPSPPLDWPPPPGWPSRLTWVFDYMCGEGTGTAPRHTSPFTSEAWDLACVLPEGQPRPHSCQLEGQCLASSWNAGGPALMRPHGSKGWRRFQCCSWKTRHLHGPVGLAGQPRRSGLLWTLCVLSQTSNGLPFPKHGHHLCAPLSGGRATRQARAPRPGECPAACNGPSFPGKKPASQSTWSVS